MFGENAHSSTFKEQRWLTLSIFLLNIANSKV